MDYINLRHQEIPEEMGMSENTLANLKKVYLTFNDRKKGYLPAENLTEMHYEYATLFEFAPVIDLVFIDQMSHPNRGYLTRNKGGYTFEELEEIYKF